MSDRARRAMLTFCVAAAGALGAAPAEAPKPGEEQDTSAAPLPAVSFEARDGIIELKVAADVVATYVYKDPVITRPHFRNLRAPGGALVTRAHPPVQDRDATDHADMHPGAWLAFADVGGADGWRNKAKVEHARFVDEPAGGPGRGTLAVANVYGDGRGGVVCEEVCRYTLLVRPAGYLLIADSTFRSGGRELTFGDQEEMGFGVRVATGLDVKSGGRIVDSEGRRDEAGIWGKPAAWVDYSGTVNGEGSRVGVMLIPDPANPHAARFHVRDYGLMVANPFGRAVFGDKAGGRVVIPVGADYRMRFGILMHASPSGREANLADTYEDCRRLFLTERRP